MEFNKEDQKFILEASKDLNSFQIAKILNVNKTDIDSFIKLNQSKNLTKRMMPYNKNQSLKELVTKEFLMSKIKDGFSQIEVSEQLGLRQQQLIRILKVNNLSWNKIKKGFFSQEDINFLLCKCSKCQINKHNTQFYPDKKSKSGFTSWCKACNNEYSRQYSKQYNRKLRRNK